MVTRRRGMLTTTRFRRSAWISAQSSNRAFAAHPDSATDPPPYWLHTQFGPNVLSVAVGRILWLLHLGDVLLQEKGGDSLEKMTHSVTVSMTNVFLEMIPSKRQQCIPRRCTLHVRVCLMAKRVILHIVWSASKTWMEPPPTWAPSQYKDRLSQVWGFPC